MTTIYCYSATGNTLRAARVIAAELGNCQILPCAPAMEHPNAARVGFLFPVYCAGLPRTFENFLRLFPFRRETAYFAVATCGGLPLGALAIVRDMLRRCGAELAYAAAVRSVGTAVDLYDVDIAKTPPRLAKADKAAMRAAREIRSGKGRAPGPRFRLLERLVHYPNPDADCGFTLDKNLCAVCGDCMLACPAGNIDRIDGRPVWNGNCDHCLACLHWCPARAINFGGKTENRARYHHPEVGLGELPRTGAARGGETQTG